MIQITDWRSLTADASAAGCAAAEASAIDGANADGCGCGCGEAGHAASQNPDAARAVLGGGGYDALVVGAGFAGAVVARELAQRAGKRVCVLELRPNIGGNAYDELDEHGVLVHRYGPHIFHTADERVFGHLSRFTQWYGYSHEVLADIHGVLTPVPFNLNSIEMHFDAEKASRLIDRLTTVFGEGAKVPIIELRAQNDELLAELADFVYRNVFLYYTQKQWGLKPEEVDPSVTARVPVLVGRDNRYFQDPFQGMPQDGYTRLFENLLDHPNIDVFVNVDARDVLRFSTSGAATPNDGQLDGAEPFTQVLLGGAPFDGEIIYTGPLDFLCDWRYGKLPYRSLDFVYKHHDVRHVLPCGTVNYTVSEDYTRITEYSWLTGQDIGHTTIMEEYPRAFEDCEAQVPYYAILDAENIAHHGRYLALFQKLGNFHALGRLAEYRYYNMDQIVARALALSDELVASSQGGQA
jgi:UDP-galactopyranose mutase